MSLSATSARVSVIIPCFNAKDFVGEAIGSALDQTCPDVEVIVIDDGSTDGSVEVLRSFGERIRWETGPNRGACAARNRGLRLARGEFIQFLDADDRLALTKIERQLPEALKSEQELVFCDGQAMQGASAHAHWVRKEDLSDSVVFMLNGGLPTPGPLHRRWWLEAVGGFSEHLPCAQERDLHLRIAALGVLFRRIPEALYYVRTVQDSLSHNVIRVLEQHLGIAESVRDMLVARDALTNSRAEALAAFLARDARMFFQRNCNQRGQLYLAAARKMHQSGGLASAYSPSTRVLLRLLGARLTERIVSLRRKAQRRTGS